MSIITDSLPVVEFKGRVYDFGNSNYSLKMNDHENFLGINLKKTRKAGGYKTDPIFIDGFRER